VLGVGCLVVIVRITKNEERETKNEERETGNEKVENDFYIAKNAIRYLRFYFTDEMD